MDTFVNGVDVLFKRCQTHGPTYHQYKLLLDGSEDSDGSIPYPGLKPTFTGILQYCPEYERCDNKQIYVLYDNETPVGDETPVGVETPYVTVGVAVLVLHNNKKHELQFILTYPLGEGYGSRLLTCIQKNNNYCSSRKYVTITPLESCAKTLTPLYKHWEIKFPWLAVE